MNRKKENKDPEHKDDEDKLEKLMRKFEIKDKKYIEKYFKECKKDNRFDFANNQLYNLCEKYPKHTKNFKEKIRAKIFLIGRSYSASIERKENHNMSTVDFYDKIIEKLIDFNEKEDFDIKISNLKEKKLNKDTIKDILKIHNKLANELTDNTKRSFASKYLHFHIPIVPIYDSKAEKALRKLVKATIKKSYVIGDSPYSKFCFMFLFLYNHIKNKFKLNDNLVRDIDKLLYSYRKHKTS